MSKLPHIIRLGGPWEILRPGESRVIGTTELPGFVRPAAKHKDAKQFDIRRSFGWVAGIIPDERVFLVLDEICAWTEVILNGKRIGQYQDLLSLHRFDVTDLLQPRNELKLRLNSPLADFPSPSGPLPALFRETPYLSMESAVARVSAVRFELHEPDAPTSVWMDVDVEVLRGPTKGLELRVNLGGACEARQDVPSSVGRHRCQIACPPVDLDPWRPRQIGLPIRHKLNLRLMTQDKTFHEETWLVGLRDVEFVEYSNEDRRARCGGREFLLIDAPFTEERAFQPGLGCPADQPVDQWDLARGNVIDMRTTFGPDAMYDAFDRIGLLWLARRRVGPALDRWIDRLSHHPCLLIKK